MIRQQAPGGDVNDEWRSGGAFSADGRSLPGTVNPDVAGESVGAREREQLRALTLGQSSPDAVRLVHPQGVVSASRHGRALKTNRLRLRFPASPGRPAFALRVEEERAGHATTGRVQ